MAYRRYRRRRYGKRRMRRKPGQSKLGYTMNLAHTALKMASITKSLLNVEFKYKDTSIAQTVTTTPSYILLNGLAEGDTESSRDGDRTRFKSIQIRGQAIQGASATAAQVVHLALVIDKQPNGGAPTTNGIFDTDADVYSFRNVSYSKRFVVLRDWLINLDDVNREQVTINFYKRLNMITMFNGTAGDITGINSNSLYLFMVSDTAVNPPSVDLSVRARYIDN